MPCIQRLIGLASTNIANDAIPEVITKIKKKEDIELCSDILSIKLAVNPPI